MILQLLRGRTKCRSRTKSGQFVRPKTATPGRHRRETARRSGVCGFQNRGFAVLPAGAHHGPILHRHGECAALDRHGLAELASADDRCRVQSEQCQRNRRSGGDTPVDHDTGGAAPRKARAPQGQAAQGRCASDRGLHRIRSGVRRGAAGAGYRGADSYNLAFHDFAMRRRSMRWNALLRRVFRAILRCSRHPDAPEARMNSSLSGSSVGLASRDCIARAAS